MKVASSSLARPTKNGIVSEWSKDAVCKPVMIKFIIVGSNPTYASKWLVTVNGFTVGRYVEFIPKWVRDPHQPLIMARWPSGT